MPKPSERDQDPDETEDRKLYRLRADSYRWCEIDPDLPLKRVPKWARRAALAPDGTVFVAVVAGSEATVFVCASYDGTPVLADGRHAYYPAEWMAREFPSARDTALTIERRVREFFAPGAG